MELTVLERLVALGLLPPEGNVATLRLIRNLVEKVGLTAEEYEFYKVEEKDGNLLWDLQAEPQSNEFELKLVELNILREALEKLNSEEKLTSNHLSLYEKIVE